MTAYYNENDKHAAAWLKELIKDKLIAPGDVDDRSILDVDPKELHEYTQHHFFAGIGVWSYALRIAGWPDEWPVVTGSCPCQPFSAAGQGKGVDDDRHLWPAFSKIIKELRPAVVIGEQVASPDVVGRVSCIVEDTDATTWIDVVQADLETSHYTFGAVDIPAAGVGSPNLRQRLFFVGLADTDGVRFKGFSGGREKRTPQHSEDAEVEWLSYTDGKKRPSEPGILPVVNGTTRGVVRSSDSREQINDTHEARSMRLKGYGNAINAECGRVFVQAVMDQL